MEKALVAIFIAPFMLIFIISFGALGGALTGLILDLFFGTWIRAGLEPFGVNLTGTPLWMVGLSLGFVGGFFRTVNTKS